MTRKTKYIFWGGFVILMIPLIVFLKIYFNSNVKFEIIDNLGGNIFPSAILSVATTDTIIVKPADSMFVGNPKSEIAIKIHSTRNDSRVRVEIEGTQFFARSVSEFILEKANTDYTIYPDIIWNYQALSSNTQATPISVVASVEMNGADLGQKVRTFSVRGINECMLGYISNRKFHDTGIFFAAYVNEENPMIDKILREALNTRIINRFSGYQTTPQKVDRQVYALWNVLQRRHFRYSSISNSSLSSNVVFSQRVRTFDDAIASSQINCVDGTVLMASLLRAINIEPVLVRIPNHMFIGYYLDKKHTQINFLEMTMVGDVDLDDYFPEEKLDSTMIGMSQNQASRIIFEKSKEYATKKYQENDSLVNSGKLNYMFLPISKNIRKNIQPISKQ